MPHITHRRVFGLLLGTATGLAYGLVSQLVNSLIMPQIPLYQPPFGTLGNIILATFLGAVLGLASAWPDTGFKGVAWSSLLGSLAMIIATLLSGRTDAEVWVSKITAVVILFFPTAAVLSPMLILFRWIAGREEVSYLEQLHAQEVNTWQRVLLPVLLVVVAGATGLFSLYNDLGRAVTPRMHALIQEGMQARSVEELPKPLQHAEIDLFMEKAKGSYTLQWDKDDTNRFAIPRPATSQFDQSTVIARFSNGYWLVCMYPSHTGQPRCKDF